VYFVSNTLKGVPPLPKYLFNHLIIPCLIETINYKLIANKNPASPKTSGVMRFIKLLE
jgi:hypothetical protein